MILFINTSQTDLIEVKLIKDDKIVRVEENHENYKQSELLLSMIDKVIKKKGLRIKDLDLIAVVSGPGAFSALRLGITTANTLAWSLGISIVEVTSTQVTNDETLLKVLKEKIINHQSSIIIPKYGREPNITHSTPELSSVRSGQAKSKK